MCRKQWYSNRGITRTQLDDTDDIIEIADEQTTPACIQCQLLWEPEPSIARGMPMQEARLSCACECGYQACL